MAAPYDAAPRWRDRPPTYERLLVDTLVDIRKQAHKHAVLTSKQSQQKLSPLTPMSDGSSIHTEGTFDIDLKSIWSQKTDSTLDADELSLASLSRAPSPDQRSRPRSLGDESFFPTPVSPVSFLPGTDADDDDIIPLDLDEPAPAYDAASSASASTAATAVNVADRAASTSGVPGFDPALLDGEDEDPWVAFAALCWAVCVSDAPDAPPRAAFARYTHTAAPRLSSPAYADHADAADEDGAHEAVSLAPLRYHTAFARTEPDLTIGVWRTAERDNAVARALGLEDELGFDMELDLGADLEARSATPSTLYSARRQRTRTPVPPVRKLEYVPPRPPSPPRKFAPVPPHAHARANSGGGGGGFKRLWRWRGKESALSF